MEYKKSLFKECFGDLPIETQKRLKETIIKIEAIL
jgi:hypothetical protein